MADAQLGALFVDLILDKDGKYQTALRNAQKQTANAGKQMEAAMDKLKGLVAGIGIAAVVNQSVKAFQDSEAAVGKLSAAIGGSAAYNKKMVDSLTEVSASIMKMTVLDDDAVTSAMAFGKSLGMPTEKLGEYAKAAVGLSQRLRIDLDSSMKIIQKASNGNVTALQKLGVNFDGAGTKAEKLDAVLKFAADGFEQAQRYAGTAAGRMEKFKVMIGEAAEKLGGALMPILGMFLALATPLLEWLTKIPTVVVGGILALGGIIYVLANIKQWITDLVIAWKAVTVAATAAYTAMGNWGTAVAVAAAITAVVLALKYASDQSSETSAALAKKLNNLDGFMKDIAGSSDKAAAAIANMKEAQSSIKDAPENPLVKQAQDLKTIIDNTKEATKAEMERRRALIGSIEITDIAKKAVEAGLRERFSTTVVNQGDLARGVGRDALGAMRAGLTTRRQFDMAFEKQKSDDSSGKLIMQQIYMLLQEKLQSGDRGLGYGWN